jgi:hypothetical protein
MERLWARQAPVTCIHPGWGPLTGRAEVMASWRAILSDPDPTNIMCHDDTAFLHGDVAIVLCEEDLSGGRLAATNLFVREAGEWRLAHHQAGPLVAEQPRAPPARRH